jgi:hypothetical protein
VLPLAVLAGVFAGLAAGGRAAADDPVSPAGSAFLRGLEVREPPFGRLVADVYPYDGVRMQRWRRDEPAADWVVVWVDLRTPGLGYAASEVHYLPGPGGDPVQAAYAQTTLAFLEKHGGEPRVDLAFNTVAYYVYPAYGGSPVYLSEPVWVGDDNKRDPVPGSWMLGLLPGRAVLGEPAKVRSAHPLHAFGSFHGDGQPGDGIAVKDGVPGGGTEAEHARTVVGAAEDGRVLIVLVADGYNPGVSIGLSQKDSGVVLAAAGARDGIFLDGGGSSTLVGRDDGKAAVLNRPAGLQTTPGTLRYVAANFGFTGLRRTEDPLPALANWKAPALEVAWKDTVTWARVYPLRATLAGAGIVAVLGVGGFWVWRRRRRTKRVRAR